VLPAHVQDDLLISFGVGSIPPLGHDERSALRTPAPAGLMPLTRRRGHRVAWMSKVVHDAETAAYDPRLYFFESR
jgi:hypothetical protein